MSSDPLPVPDILSDPPHDVDERAFVAELTVADEAPLQVTAALVRGLADLATAIEQVAAFLAAGESAAPDGLFAAERIQDLAWALRQRHGEEALCDALDVAIREISDAIVGSKVATNRVAGAADLLRDLARRANDMMALVKPLASHGAGADVNKGGLEQWTVEIAATPTAGELPAGELVEKPAVEISPTVGREPAGSDVAADGDSKRFDDTARDSFPEARRESAPATEYATAQQFTKEPAKESAPDSVDMRSSDEHRSDSPLLEPALLLRSVPETPISVDSDDDPADLFEPVRPPVPSPLSAAEGEEHDHTMVAERQPASRASFDEAAASVVSPSPVIAAKTQAALPPDAPSPQPIVVADAAEQVAAQAAASDPLAAVLALSEEELIALFS